jgi:hypothetical protein
MERYRPYLALSPDEALARLESAEPSERQQLRFLAGHGWGPIQIYFRLPPDLFARLRAGERLLFSQAPGPDEHLLPPDLVAGIFQSRRDRRVVDYGNRLDFTSDLTDPRGRELATVPEVRAWCTLHIQQNEPGHYIFNGDDGCFIAATGDGFLNSDEPYAAARSPVVLKPDNAVANSRWQREPALAARVSIRPTTEASDAAKVGTDDLLEAIHRASGMPVVGDHFTRLYPAAALLALNDSLFEGVNQLGDATRMRWDRDEGWLQFRTTSFFHDRLREVPNHCLRRWSEKRREQGMLRLDDLVEIAGLTDAQLGAAEMAEGARERFGLLEWDIARDHMMRVHLRFLAGFSPEERQEMLTAAGLLFTRMSLGQQQQFLSFLFGPRSAGIRSLAELEGATLRVDYVQPGCYEWQAPGPMWFGWIVPGEPGRRTMVLPARGRTLEEALQAARARDPRVLRAMWSVAHRLDPRIVEAEFAPQASQIVRTELDLRVIYISSASHQSVTRVIRPSNNWGFWTEE